MKEVLTETESLCPVCLSRIPAKRVVERGDVYLEKDCPKHSSFRALIWRNAELYRNWSQYSQQAGSSQKRLTDITQGCPYDCGLCPDHEADTCTTVMEVTHKCNLDCPICFASGNEGSRFEPDIATIRGMYQTIVEAGGPYPVQMSGGEPTLRDDLPAIVALGKKLGFYHIQINTNGIRIAQNKEYLARLKDSGADLIYLQFDGVSDDVYRVIRGRNLFDLKVRAISNCAEVRMGVILVPTVVPNVNLHQLGDIIRFAKQWIPTVKGVHFQPVSYFGRYPWSPKDEDRVTLPDIVNGLVAQTNGELKETDFLPRRCEDSHCSFSSFFVLMEDGKLQARTDIAQEAVSGFGYRKDPPAVTARNFISRRWRLASEKPKQTEKGCGQCCGPNQEAWRRFLERESLYYLTITGMPFQDVWTLDLHRLKRCCVHVVTSNKQLIPLCAFYVTSISGERLYQNLPTDITLSRTD
ncbi:MAG: radical SAM protein [Chloroflexi bacterium]|nr:radical SAM protein [Chloroflexota bacterium]